MIMKKFALLSFAMAALTVSAFAADASGKWKGKITMDLSAVKKMIRQKEAGLAADKKAAMEKQVSSIEMTEKMMSASTVTMELKKDGSVTIAQTVNGRTENDKGKWKQSGNKVTLSGFTKGNGPKEMTGVLSANGKSLNFDLSEEMKKEAAKNGAPAGFSGKVGLSFNKA